MKSGLGGMSSKHVRSSGVSDNLIYSTLLWKLGKGKRLSWAGLVGRSKWHGYGLDELCPKTLRFGRVECTGTVSGSMSYGQTLNVTTTSFNFGDIKCSSFACDSCWCF